MVSVRAIYQDGKLQLLDPVDLIEGQEVQLQIVPATRPITDLVRDLLVSFDDTSETASDDDALLSEIEQQLRGQRPLSEIIIEDRQ